MNSFLEEKSSAEKTRAKEKTGTCPDFLFVYYKMACCGIKVDSL